MGNSWNRVPGLDSVHFYRYSAGHQAFKKKTEQSQSSFDDILVSALGTPLILFLLGLGLSFFTDVIPPIPGKWQKYSHALLIILFAMSGALFFDRVMIGVLRKYSKKVDLIASSAGVMKTFYRAVILSFVFLIILDRLKITITPFLASLGIGGLVVALALQDTLSNFFSGIYLYFDKPIQIGDYIKLESGEEGYVTHVGWHSTRIRMLSNNAVILSNAKLSGSRIVNFYLPERETAVLVNVGVSYNSDLEHVERVTIEVAREVLQKTEGGVKEFEPLLRYSAFGEFAINFTVVLRAKEYADQYVIVHEFIKRLQPRYQAEGIEIPSPVRMAYAAGGALKG